MKKREDHIADKEKSRIVDREKAALRVVEGRCCMVADRQILLSIFLA